MFQVQLKLQNCTFSVSFPSANEIVKYVNMFQEGIRKHPLDANVLISTEFCFTEDEVTVKICRINNASKLCAR